MKFKALDFFEKLEPLIANGISLDQSLKIINKNAQIPLLKLFLEEINKGLDLSEILTRRAETFSSLDLALIKAGENSGHLSQFLQKLIAYRKNQTQFRAKIKKALVYPVLILTLSLIISFAMILFIIPQFQTVFANFDATLPWLTREVISLADFCKKYGVVFLVFSCFIFIFLNKLISKKPIIRCFLQEFLLKIPLLGKLMEKIQLSLCCYLIASTQQGGIPLLTSLELAKQATDLLPIQIKLTHCQNALRQGALFSEVLRTYALIDSENLALLEVGEASGRLPEMLDLIAERFAQSTESQLNYLGTLIEPVVMLFLALIAGTLIVAMYLPIFSMGIAIH